MPLSREHSSSIRNPEFSFRAAVDFAKFAGRNHSEEKGKRGSVRIIYYWYSDENVIYMLLAYSKGERDDLTASQKRALKKLITEEFE